MKKLTLTSGLLLAFAIGGYVFLRTNSESEKITAPKPAESVSANDHVSKAGRPPIPISKTKKRGTTTTPSTDASDGPASIPESTPIKSNGLTKTDVEVLLRASRQARTHLRFEKSREIFQSSPADTLELLMRSLATLQKPYALPLDRDQATSKVMAIQALTYSRHARPSDAFEVLENLIQTFNITESVRGPTGADLLAVTRLCRSLDEHRLRTVAARTSGTPAAGVLTMAFAH